MYKVMYRIRTLLGTFRGHNITYKKILVNGDGPLGILLHYRIEHSSL